MQVDISAIAYISALAAMAGEMAEDQGLGRYKKPLVVLFGVAAAFLVLTNPLASVQLTILSGLLGGGAAAGLLNLPQLPVPGLTSTKETATPPEPPARA